jgi:hypothetical protein
MKKYEKPVIEIIVFSSEDVITTSGGRAPIETEEDIFW